MEVLDEVADSQLNLSSESARETLSNLVSAALKSKGHYRRYPTDDKSSDTWPGLDTILTTSDSEVIESPSISRQELIEQAYREVTADGLPQGGDVEAMKLAEAIVDDLKEGDYIYESPDGGGTVFRRKFKDYDPKNKEEIDWKTKEPTGRKFNQYNNGNWSDDEN